MSLVKMVARGNHPQLEHMFASKNQKRADEANWSLRLLYESIVSCQLINKMKLFENFLMKCQWSAVNKRCDVQCKRNLKR